MNIVNERYYTEILHWNRWNFSVGQHNLVLVPHSDIYCQNEVTPRDLDIEIKVIVPDGLIWAVNRNDPTVKLWQHKVSFNQLKKIYIC